jgi:DNA-binding response OmpR family regulator
MSCRVLIVDRDARHGAWLRAHVGSILQDARIDCTDPSGLRERIGAPRAFDADLLMLVMDFGQGPEDPASEGLEWLRRLRDEEGMPPVVAIANDGNELTAVRALRLGAADYLPKRLLTPSRLATALKVLMRAVERHRANAARRAEKALTATGRDAGATGRRLKRDLIPRYAILDVLGESDRAIVYLATSLELDRLVALKVSRRDEEANDEAPAGQLFAREHEAISAIHHPAIVDIYDYGLHAGHEYLAMEYFPCGDLKGRLKQGLDADAALDYAARIARALEVVHAAGLIHRDLKPPNVMLRENDEVVLIDFGLARAANSAGTTRTGRLRGSPYYMSPEQAQGLLLDARTDLYSLGVILFEMLAGRKPFNGNSAIEVLQNHVAARIPALPAEHARFQPVVERLLAKLPGDRYGSAAEVAAALEGLRDDSARRLERAIGAL